MSDKILIKKYPNRRLYNTEESVYITVHNVSELIKKGHQVEVIDATSGEDMTALVLTQIIMSKAKEDKGLLPVSLLHLVIQFGESHLHEFFDNYLEKSMENYLAYRKGMDDQLKTYLDMGMDFSTLAGQTFHGMDSFKKFTETFNKYEKDKE